MHIWGKINIYMENYSIYKKIIMKIFGDMKNKTK